MENKYKNYSLYWGDIHIHSAISRGCFKFGLQPKGYDGTPLDCYRFAKEVAKLDFAAVTDHDCIRMKREMTEKDWKKTIESAEKMNKKGEFVTIPAYEYTNNLYGHYNVYFQEPNLDILSCDVYVKPSQLWKALAKQKNVLTIPHHVARYQTPLDWNYYHKEFEPVTEITSGWGDYEFAGNEFECDPNWSPSIPGHFVRDALQRGYMLGFVGGGDIHNGRSGGRFDIDVHKMENLPQHLVKMLTYRKHPLGGGLTGVYTDSLSREKIFEAIKKRRCYATSGYKIAIKFWLNEHVMGESASLKKEYPPGLKVKVDISNVKNLLHSIEIIRNGHTLARGGGGGREEIEFTSKNIATFKFTDKFKSTLLGEVLPDIVSPEGKNLIYYYARVTLKNGVKAWTSPVWLEK